MSKHNQDDTFSEFPFLYKFSFLLLCNIVSEIPFPYSESGYHRCVSYYVLIGTFCVTVTANVSYSQLNMYQHAYIHMHGKIPFLLFSDVIQLDILRCANKTLYNQFFCMDTFY